MASTRHTNRVSSNRSNQNCLGAWRVMYNNTLCNVLLEVANALQGAGGRIV